LFLDEPTSGLDSFTATALVETLHAITRQVKKTTNSVLFCWELTVDWSRLMTGENNSQYNSSATIVCVAIVRFCYASIKRSSILTAC
jgi:hypothetical protein